MTQTTPSELAGGLPRRRLWRRLWAWTLVALLTVWATLAAMAYYTGLHEADEVTDGQLVSAAELLLRMTAAPAPAAEPRVRLPGVTGYAPRLLAVRWSDGAVTWDPDAVGPLLPAGLSPGHHSVALTVAGTTGPWRVFVAERTQGDTVQRVAVLVDRARRAALARDFSEHLIRPALVLLPLVAVLLAFAIRGGLRPLEDLAREIERLDVDAARPLQPAWHHRELAGTVLAINRLVDRLQRQLRRERHFTADVAHELRTPLTALVLHARTAGQAQEAQPRRLALEHVERESMRAARILGQLLDFTRAQTLESATSARVDLVALAQQVVAEHAPRAHERGQDLGLVAPDTPVTVAGQDTMIGLALRNLVDNALGHTPAGTHVEVRVVPEADGGVRLWVLDDGAAPDTDAAGTSTDDAGRTAAGGLGIGLTLVERIADWHGATLERENPDPAFTTAFGLHWPAQRKEAHPAPRDA